MTVTTVRETLELDPRDRLVNQGQARLESQNQSEQLVRAELSTFVCDGEFEAGLQRILEGFFANVGGAQVQNAWVSGFYGSGKSHLLKMLAHLWENTRFGDGATARGLAEGRLPKSIRGALRELDTHAQRLQTTRVAAADTLLAGNDHVRTTVLGVILRSRGLPTDVSGARFCFWLRDEGILDTVRRRVEEKGRNWDRELRALTVSRDLAAAVLEAAPDLAAGPAEALQLFKDQFGQVTGDITTDDFVDLARRALGGEGALPLIVLVLDEAQQYIGESSRRAADFTEVSEALQTQFDGRLALVASGQSSLHGTPALQKLRDRFRIKVELTDRDVEVVTRKVLLGKKQTHISDLDAMFAASEGEVSRHLKDTRIGSRPADREIWASDYPLLAPRRRFWESCLRAVDRGGANAQLRSQLRILHDSLEAIADRPLGAVIPASELFHQIAGELLASGELLNEVHTRIQRLNDGTEDSNLRRDLAALTFLIAKLSREPAVDTGVRADAATLADLLIEDVTADSGPFRRRVEVALDSLGSAGELMRIGDEYRIQTAEGAEWDQEFRRHVASFGNDASRIGGERSQLFRGAVREIVSKLRLFQGASNAKRTAALHAEATPPAHEERTRQVMVWLRDGWECSPAECEAAARSSGADDPVVHVHIPKAQAEPLKARLVEVLAAQRVLEVRGAPSSSTGREAKQVLETRLRKARDDRDAILSQLLRGARVFVGGGDEIAGHELAAQVQSGVERGLARLYPRFAEGDHPHWKQALDRAKQGREKPFEPVGWDHEPADHPVAKEVAHRIGSAARGSRVQKDLSTPPFGWPQDAVDAALLALHSSERLRARRNGQLIPTGKLTQPQIKTTDFEPEHTVITVRQKIALRGLFQKAGVAAQSGRESKDARDYLEALGALAKRAGGAAPLPETPVSALLDQAAGSSGNAQLQLIYENRNGFEELRQRWRERADRRDAREASWRLARALYRHAEDLDPHAAAGEQLDAVRENRSLLEVPDPLPGIIAPLAEALRGELTKLRGELTGAIEGARATLAADTRWNALDAAKHEETRRRCRLVPPVPPDLGTDDALRKELEGRSLEAWRAEVDAVPARLQRALDALRKTGPGGDEPAPTRVAIRPVTLGDEQEVRKWIEDTERRLLDAVRAGPVRLE